MANLLQDSDLNDELERLNRSEAAGNLEKEHGKELDDDPGIKDAQKELDEKEKNPGFVSTFGQNRQPSNYGGNKSDRGRPWSKDNIRAVLKKRGPAGLIVTIALTGTVGIGGFFGGPSLLIVQIKEVMLEKFNTGVESAVRRAGLIGSLRTNSKTNYCSSGVSYKCKLTTMSTEEEEAYEDKGIGVEGTEEADGRVKPTSFEFNGQEIPADDFQDATESDSALGAAVDDIYDPSTSSFATDDSAWQFTEEKDGVSKRPVFTGDETTDEERQQTLQEDTKKGIAIDDDLSGATCDSSGCTDENGNKLTNPDGQPVTQEDVDQASGLSDDVSAGVEGDLSSDLKDGSAGLAAVEEDGATADSVIDSVGGAVDTAADTVKATGWIDDACKVYRTIEAVGYAAKTVRAVQLARYAMAFMDFADEVKAGDATPADTAYMGGILTDIAYDAGSAATKTLGAATDSPGYRYAAYGDKPILSIYSSEFLAGGGLTGTLIDLTSQVRNIIKTSTGADPNQACGFLANPFVGAASTAVGIAGLLIPGLDVPFGLKDAAQIAVGISISVASAVLPGLLQDIVAGNITDKNTVGFFSGEAWTSGAGSLFGTNINAAGNPPLTPSQAVVYTQQNAQIADEEAQQQAVADGPFDAYDKNTFLGSIVFSSLPYLSQMSSLTGSADGIFSMITNTFGTILTPGVSAATTTTASDFQTCQDEGYKSIGVATDPYCNPIYGIPSEYLSEDPIQVIDELGSQNVDPNTGEPIPGSAYANFVSDCIQRETPLGDENDSYQYDGSECFISNSNKDYYLAWNDLRTQQGMDDEYTTTAPATENASTGINESSVAAIGSSDDGFYEPSTPTTPSTPAVASTTKPSPLSETSSIVQKETVPLLSIGLSSKDEGVRFVFAPRRGVALI